MARTLRFSKPSFCFVPFIFNLPEGCGTFLLPETEGDSLLASLFHSLRNLLPRPLSPFFPSSLWHLYVPYLVSDKTLFFYFTPLSCPTSLLLAFCLPCSYLHLFQFVLQPPPPPPPLLRVRSGTMLTRWRAGQYRSDTWL